MTGRNNINSVLAAAIGIVVSIATPLRAEVRSFELAIGLNCPFGLGECWPQVFNGLVHLPGAHVAEEADAEHGTCIVRPLDSKMLDPKSVAKFIEDIRIGAWLRGMEATVDGRLEKHDDELVLRVGGASRDAGDRPLEFHLASLEKKIQWDFRSKLPHPADRLERSAHARLAAQWSGAPMHVRIIGPVERTKATADRPSHLELEVREFYFFGETSPRASSAMLGIRVNSPYGLTEPWPTLGACLKGLPGVAEVAKPDLSSSTVVVRTTKETALAARSWAAAIRQAGAGAELAAVEITLEGRLVKRLGQLALETEERGKPAWIPLAPLSRSVEWDHRKRREILPTAVEQRAYHRLLKRWSPKSGRVRLVGSIVTATDDTGDERCLLEVREFQVNPRALAQAKGDYSAPVAPKALRATSVKDAPGRKIRLIWAANRDSDLAGYNVYRSKSPTGSYTRVNTSLLKERTLDVKRKDAIGGADDADDYDMETEWYFVTAVDGSGNESAKSTPASPTPPAPPAGLSLTLENCAAVLSWRENTEPDFDSYSVYRSSSESGPYGEIASVLYQSTYTNFALQPGQTYLFIVTAVDGSFNESERTSRISVKVPERLAE